VKQRGDLLPGFGLTALLVAHARAAESERPDRLFEDRFAARFVQAATEASPAIGRALRDDAPSEAVLEARHASVAVRTRYFDDYVLEAVSGGCRQVVILAAGLDARAFRLRWPPGVRLWELDSPEVLTFKQHVLDRLSAVPGCERHVLQLDLREDWVQALRDSGFAPDTPTAWLIEGLLMYLEEENRDILLNRVGELSHPASRLGLDHRSGFFSPPKVAGPDDPEGTRTAAHLAAVAAAASSDRSLVRPAEWLESHGWTPELIDPNELFAEYGRPVPRLLRERPAAVPPPWMAGAIRIER
jgi:methyltransferase (TIGR00027 family)